MKLERKFVIGQRVKVIVGTEDGGDDWSLGSIGTVRNFDDEYYYEVELDGHGKETYQFGEYQLDKATNEEGGV